MNKKYINLIAKATACMALPFIAISAHSQGLEEIVVTAQKREQNLQDTPIAVTAFGAKDLQNKNISDISEIAEFSPSLVFDATAPLSGASSAAVLFIRGVGQSSFQVTDDPGVGTYVDGVYVGSSVGGVLDVVDVERIEVLRGPQGTLFGRNTIGGAINITTQRPDADGGSSVSITGGNFNRINVRASTNLAFSENLVGKLSAGFKRADGYVELLTLDDLPDNLNGPDIADVGVEGQNRAQRNPGDDNEGAARFALNYEASDDLNFYFTAERSEVREASAGSTLLGVTTSSPSAIRDAAVAAATGLGTQAEIDAFADAVQASAVVTTRADGIQADTDGAGGIGAFGQLADTFNARAIQNAIAAANNDLSAVNPADLLFYDERWVPENPSRQSFRNGVNGTTITTTGTSITMDWDISDNVALKTISSYRKVEAALNRDADGSPLVITHCFNDFDHEQYSQEIQLTGLSFDSKLQWLAGVYYFDEDAVDDFRCNLGGSALPGTTPLLLRASVENDSKAAFAQGTWSFTDQLSLTLGGRFTEDNKSLFPEFALVSNFTPTGIENTLFQSIPDILAEENFTDFSARVAVDYQATDDLLLYASYSEGFKSGGFSSRTLVPRSEPLAFDPEELATIELGAKYQTPNGRLRVNGAVFASDYESIQGTVIEGIAPGTQNTGDSDIEGFELEVTGLATDNFQITANVSYIDNEYTRLAPLTSDVASNGVIFITDKLPNTPEWSGSVGIDYTIPLANANSLVFRGDVSFYSEIYNDDRNSQLILQPSYELISGQIAYESSQDWSLVLWGKNLGDEEYIISGDDNDFLGFREVNFGHPRSYGVTLTRNF